jgi:hypothetical protein
MGTENKNKGGNFVSRAPLEKKDHDVKRRFHGNHCIHLMLPTSCKGNCLILARKRQFTDLNLKHTKGSNSFLSDGNRNYITMETTFILTIIFVS